MAELKRLTKERYDAICLYRWVREYAPVLCIWLGPFNPQVVLTDPRKAKAIVGAKGPLVQTLPEYYKIILHNDTHYTVSTQIQSKNKMYRFLHPWLGTGLLTSDGDKWKSRRKLLTKSFHFDILRQYHEIFVQEAKNLIAKLAMQPTGKSFHIYPFVTRATLDMIMLCAMGTSIAEREGETDVDTDEKHPYIQSVYRHAEETWKRIVLPFLHPDWIYFNLWPNSARKDCQIMHNHTDAVINERKAQIEKMRLENENRSKSEATELTPEHFLDVLLMATDDKGRAALSPAEVREEVDTFMFEGHDTTAAAISWTIYFLGCYPEVQRRLQEEIDAVLGRDETPSPEKFKPTQMPYLHAVVKESLRILPPVPFFSRHATEEVHVENYTIPAGTDITMLPVVFHTLESIWGDDSPNFRPERWLKKSEKGTWKFVPPTKDAQGEKWCSFNMMPFSAGSRNCIGQNFALLETKVTLAMLYRKFSTVTPKEQVVRAQLSLILRPKNGKLLVQLREREMDLSTLTLQ